MRGGVVDERDKVLKMATIFEHRQLDNYSNITVDFNSLFTEMFRISFRTSEVRCEVQKFIMNTQASL